MKNHKPPNLLMAVQAENFAHCAFEASKLIESKPDAKYFFWSAKYNFLGKSVYNCLIFKSCDGRKFIDLKTHGYTYRICPSNGIESFI